MEACFCPECGSALDQAGLCTNPICANHQAHSNKKKSPFQSKSFAEKEKKIVPECVEPDLDEIHIKQYDLARLQTLIKGAFAEGRLQVTNKRVLFRSSGSSILGPTALQYEFSIEEIAGVEIRKESRFNFFSSILLGLFTYLIHLILDPIFTVIASWGFIGVVLSILMAVAAAFFFLVFKEKKVLRHIVLSAPFSWFISNMTTATHLPDNALARVAFWITLCIWVVSFLHLVFAPNLVVAIKTKGGTPSIEIRRKDGFFSFHHNEYTGFAQVMPGPDTDIAMKEIGSLIREVQQTGMYSKADALRE